MLHGILQVLLYAVLAGLSPIAFAATIAVTRAGRTPALAFAIGFVATQAVTFALLLNVEVGIAGRDRHTNLQAAMQLLVAAGLVWLAGAAPRLLARHRTARGDRMQRLLDRLARVHMRTAFGAGVLLGVGAKRLALGVLTAAVITTSGFSISGEGILSLVYVVVATSVVWAPVIVYLFFGERVVTLMKRAQDETARRQPHVTVHLLLLLAGLFALDAVGKLLAG